MWPCRPLALENLDLLLLGKSVLYVLRVQYKDLKIEVAVRIRINDTTPPHLAVIGLILELNQSSIKYLRKVEHNSKKFNFYHVYGCRSAQEEIFKDMSPLIQVMAYDFDSNILTCPVRKCQASERLLKKEILQ